MDIIKTGDNLPLMVSLDDRRDDQFVRAQVLDLSGSVMSTSTLNNLGGGMYGRGDVVAPPVGVYVVRYEVFRDAGLTSLNRSYGPLLRPLRVENIEQNIQDNLDLSDGRTA